jgi:hypothetical protein
MSIDVETKDCTALSDAEIAEIADLTAEGPVTHEIGTISKETETWVLVTRAHQGAKLKAFAFSTLERIGGTPSVLIGFGGVQRSSKRDTALRGLVNDLLRRAVLAFPDEDVLITARFADASGFEAFKPLTDVVPRPDHKVSGEERAWGRRIAKRLGVPTRRYVDREFTVKGDGTSPLVLDHEALDRSKTADDYAEFFAGLSSDDGDSIIATGWAMAEDLAKLV